LFPGSYINVRPIGVLLMEDEHGVDEKIIAVPVTRLTKRYVEIENYTDLPEITIEQIQHFFEHYKDLEPGKWVKLIGWGDRAEALLRIRQSIDRMPSTRG
jgi:inorganic pyrophosphatase